MSNGTAWLANIGGTGGSGIVDTISGSALTYCVGGAGANGILQILQLHESKILEMGQSVVSGASFQQRNGARGCSGIIIIVYY